MRSLLAILSCLLITTQAAVSQDLPMVTGEDSNPLMMLDDITQSLLADDQLASSGLDVTKSLLEDLGGGGAPAGDPIAPDAPGDPGNDPGTVPIDGGLSLLLAAGAAFGARRIKRSRSVFDRVKDPIRSDGLP